MAKMRCLYLGTKPTFSIHDRVDLSAYSKLLASLHLSAKRTIGCKRMIGHHVIRG
jgi:hypothetical protein